MAAISQPVIDPNDLQNPGDGAVVYPTGVSSTQPVGQGIPEGGTPYVPDPSIDQYKYQTGVNGEKNYDINLGMTGGLMDTISAIDDSKYANNNYAVRGGRAVNRRVQDQERSQYQLEQMLASDSPLMKQAAAQGLARGGARGLMNSSLATGASQGAMIAGAEPFALQDASWYGRTAADNMSATNDMERANLGARTASMQAGAARDRQILAEQLSGYGDIRKALIGIEDREDTQAYGTAERVGQQDYNAAQNDLNRIWTSSENLMDRSLSQWQTQVDAGVRLGMSREQAFSEMYSSIMTSTAKGFTAAKKAQAVRDMAATLDARYAQSPEPVPGPFETSYRNGAVDESLMLPPAQLPGTSTQVYGNTTITTHADGTISMDINSDMGDAQAETEALADV